MNEYQVKAHWDEEAKVWWSESDDIPGLCVEALTFEELEKCLSDLIADFKPHIGAKVGKATFVIPSP